jgi:hypothetical protein
LIVILFEAQTLRNVAHTSVSSRVESSLLAASQVRVLGSLTHIRVTCISLHAVCPLLWNDPSKRIPYPFLFLFGLIYSSPHVAPVYVSIGRASPILRSYLPILEPIDNSRFHISIPSTTKHSPRYACVRGTPISLFRTSPPSLRRFPKISLLIRRVYLCPLPSSDPSPILTFSLPSSSSNASHSPSYVTKGLPAMPPHSFTFQLMSSAFGFGEGMPEGVYSP